MFKHREEETITKAKLDSWKHDPAGPALQYMRETTLRGFCCVQTRNGTKTFKVEGTVKGKGVLRQKALKRYPECSPADARAEAGVFLGKIRNGIDPWATVEDARGRTVKEAVADYLVKKDPRPLSPRSKRDVEYLSTWLGAIAESGEALDDWLSRPIFSIKRREIGPRHKAIARMIAARNRAKYRAATRKYHSHEGRTAYSGESTANAVLSLLGTLIQREVNAWDEDVFGLPPANVVVRGLSGQGKAGWFEKKARERKLDEQELRTLFEVHRDWTGNFLLPRFNLIGLHAGLRAQEISHLEWTWLNEAKGTLTLPAWLDEEETESIVKSRREFILPLTDSLRAVFAELREYNRQLDIAECARWMFPSPLSVKAEGRMNDDQRAAEVMSKKCGFKFGSHDLRRTFATIAGNLGAGEMMVAGMLNQRIQSVTGKHYFKPSPAERLVWMKKVEAYLLTLVPNVAEATSSKAA